MADQPLHGRVAIVTGGASGIGRATAIDLAANGAAVAVLDREPAGSRDTVEAIEGAGGSAKFFEIDFSDASEIPNIVQQVVGWAHRVDILVNSAGASGPVPLLEMTEAVWDRMLAVNLKAP